MLRYVVFSVFYTLAILFFMYCSAPLASANSLAPPLSPTPQSYECLPGRFTPTPSATITGLPAVDETTRQALLNLLKSRQIAVKASPDPTAMEIRLEVASQSQNPEGYFLQMNQTGSAAGTIILRSTSDRGFFYGVQTLKQLLAHSSLPNLRIVDFPALARRGVVEGFYGTPWTHQDRLDQLRFYGERKLNTYIYAPKDDPYHREKWREAYPPAKRKRLQELIAAAKRSKVDFVFALSPGLDIRLNGEGSEADAQALLAKFEALYQLGARHFAVFFDDIENKDGVGQAKLLNRTARDIVHRMPDAAPLLTVPTEYYSADMLDESGHPKHYTRAFATVLAPKIRVMYTGPGVVCPGIPEEDIATLAAIYRRKMDVWWNYPVNDYQPQKIALGPIDGLPQTLPVHGASLIMNPMEHAVLSKITLQTGADYAWNPTAYEPQAAWENAIAMQYGRLGDAMRVFAAHSSHMQNHWANTGRPDAPQLQATANRLWNKLAANQNPAEEIRVLEQIFSEMAAAAEMLETDLPPSVYKSCRSQLKHFAALARYDATALDMLRAYLRSDQSAYAKLRRQTERNRVALGTSKALLSEAAAAIFIERSLKELQ